jgi:hypothetical protein
MKNEREREREREREKRESAKGKMGGEKYVLCK